MPGQTLAQQFRDGFVAGIPAPLGLAVSGGGDSMALLCLAADLGVPLRAVTVDHGLRAEARAEAAFVSETCAALGVPHDILRWEGWNGQGNLQAAARDARYGLIAQWAQGAGVAAVALGHTLDDQAETFLMRLARGSGVDGLSAMRADFLAHGQRWLRPMLALRRNALRDHLQDLGRTWVEDPSNDDTGFDRIKARQALTVLSGLGMDAPTLADTAARMSLARSALQEQAQALALRICTQMAGSVAVKLEEFQSAPEEIQLRLVAAAVRWVSGAPYRPRLSALRDAVAQASAGTTRSLAGCLLIGRGGALHVVREYNAVRDLCCPVGATWDGRWQLTGPNEPGSHIAALGEKGLKHCPDWRETGYLRAALLASPAVWRDGNLIAAPCANFANGWRAELAQEHISFIHSLDSH